MDSTQNQPQPQYQQPPVQPQPQPQYQQTPQLPVVQPPQAPQPQPVDQSAEIAQLKQTVGQLTQYVNQSGQIIQAIAGNPELAKQVRAAVTGEEPQAPTQQPTQPQQPTQIQPQQPQPDPYTKNMDLKMRGDVVEKIEGKYGYHGLTPEQKKELRGKIE